MDKMEPDFDLHIEKCMDLDSCMDWLDELHEEQPEYEEWLRTEDDRCLYVCHGFGTWLRNTLQLWFDGPPVKWFNKHGIYHADDMSSIILQSTHRRHNKRAIDFEGQIKVYRDYWNKCNPKVNKGIL
jgi:hypothetical protein